MLAIAILMPCVAASSYADSEKVVFYLDKHYSPVAKLDRIAPLSEGVKAVLAMYALQNGGGCESGSGKYACTLTDALAIGGQCSEQHISLVYKWFKKGMPKMGGYADDAYKNFDKTKLSNISYSMPDTASFQNKWDLIKVTVSNNHVLVYAHGSWVAREDSGSFKYVSEYELGTDSVIILSHKEITN